MQSDRNVIADGTDVCAQAQRISRGAQVVSRRNNRRQSAAHAPCVVEPQRRYTLFLVGRVENVLAVKQVGRVEAVRRAPRELLLAGADACRSDFP